MAAKEFEVVFDAATVKQYPDIFNDKRFKANLPDL